MANEQYTSPSMSRSEEIVQATIDGTEYNKPPQSRLETLLIELKEAVEAGSGESSDYATALSLTINSSTYVITANLLNKDGDILGTAQTIDLPIESVVVSGSYDAQTKKVILTLQSGSTIEFSVADLVSGLQSEITSANKLDADLIDDSTSINKFVTSAEKTTWNNKSDFSGNYNDLTNKPTIPSMLADLTDDITHRTVTDTEKTTWNAKSDFSGSYNDLTDKPAIPVAVTVDQTYDSTSTNPQSGTAVAGAIVKKPGEITTGKQYTIDGQTVTAGTGAEAFNDLADNKASGDYSHAEGFHTTASSDNQHVQGKYNVEDANGTYAFIIGNGIDNARHNAFAIDWNGLIYVNGAATGVDVSALATAVSAKIGATDYATQTTGGTVKVWTTTESGETTLHISTQ